MITIAVADRARDTQGPDARRQRPVLLSRGPFFPGVSAERQLITA
ncbi:MAG: hypothetical protein AAFR04_01190 [Pseudomonadota bacterium]